MSLNTWSIIVFAIHLVFYTTMSLLIATQASMSKLIVFITSWVLWMITILWYGIATHQVGFILMFVFQLVITLGSIIFSAERYMNDNR